MITAYRPHPIPVQLLLLVLILGGCQPQKSSEEAEKKPEVTEPEWVSLFDGQTLNGWQTVEGEVPFSVEDGMIVSETQLDVPNGYLATTKSYQDFILELEVKIDTSLNSGIQIRSQIWDRDTTTTYLAGNGKVSDITWTAGTAWGYQIEVDPTDRAWSGGLYEPGNRGWLVTLADNEAGRNAYQRFDWNHFRIEARGNQIKTWVNGVMAVDAQDDVLTNGWIGLQFHEAYHDHQVGKKVYWRNIRIQDL